MENEKLPIIYEDNDVVVYDKPPGVNSDDIPGRAHRLDKDTSGVLVAAKNDETLKLLQEQFKERKTEKKYLVLAAGNISDSEGEIKTLLGRSAKDRRKQKVYLPNEPGAEGKREAITEYKVLERLPGYTFLEAIPKTGRKHQIRAHLNYLGHPIAGDRLYGFKNQPCPERLERQFLHANYLKIKLPNGQEKTFWSDLPENLKKVIKELEDKNK